MQQIFLKNILDHMASSKVFTIKQDIFTSANLYKTLIFQLFALEENFARQKFTTLLLTNLSFSTQV